MIFLCYCLIGLLLQGNYRGVKFQVLTSWSGADPGNCFHLRVQAFANRGDAGSDKHEY
jgi:hypothetical protein